MASLEEGGYTANGFLSVEKSVGAGLFPRGGKRDLLAGG